MKCALHACAEFWKDVKDARKNASQKSVFETSLGEDAFVSSDTESKIDSIDILRAIATLVQNIFEEPKKFSVALDRQPFIEHGLNVYKLRFAADGRGKSAGLRIIYALGKERTVIFICLKFKNTVENEQKFETEAFWRMQEFLKINGSKNG